MLNLAKSAVYRVLVTVDNDPLFRDCCRVALCVTWVVSVLNLIG